MPDDTGQYAYEKDETALKAALIWTVQPTFIFGNTANRQAILPASAIVQEPVTQGQPQAA